MFNAGAVGDQFILMYDNACPNTARAVQDYLQRDGIVHLNWSVRSPYIDSVEYIWIDFSSPGTT